jgi:Ca-activated chloride channel family protein
MALVVVVGGAWAGYRQLSEPNCSGDVRLAVAAAPEIAPAVRAAAEEWTGDGAAAEGTCVSVQVEAAAPVEVAAAIASRQGATLTGVGPANGATQVPDVWVPDASTWLLRLQKAAPGLVPQQAPSVARSSVVVAVPEPIAKQLGWPDKKVTYADLLQAIQKNTQMHPGIVEPARDASGLSGLLALSAAANAAGATARETTVAVLKGLAVGNSTVAQDLLNKFPTSNDPTALATAKVSAAPLSEQALISYNRGQPPVRLAALYLAPEPPPLDYPYVALPGLDSVHTAAADGLRKALSGGSFRDQLATQGLRGADGVAGSGFSAPRGAPVDVTPSPGQSGQTGGSAAGGLDTTAVDRALRTWTTMTQPARMLAVIDVSGSMKTPVPTAGNKTRLQVTVEAALRGLALFDDSWALGTWEFSTNLIGNQDWRELMPIGPLSAQRTQAQQVLTQLRPRADTGLYDTMLAAYKRVLDGYDPGRVNSIVMMTDGENDDPSGGLSLNALLTQLKKLVDPNKPIRVIMIGIGNAVSEAAMKAITNAAGGSSGVYLAPDPAKISEIFLQAIASR